MINPYYNPKKLALNMLSFDELDSVCAEMERLKAIVDKLPKFADTGGPIICPVQAWIVDTEMRWLSGYEAEVDKPNVVEIMLWNRNKDHYAFAIAIGVDREPDFADGPIYSTREAAEEAARKAKP